MATFSNEVIFKIEKTLRLHSNYKGVSSGCAYLREMDKLASSYKGAKSIALSNMLNDYYKQIGVNNLEEALDRLRTLENKMLSNEQIANFMLSDMEAYNGIIKDIIISRLMDSSNVRLYWDAWFRGATRKDLEKAEKGIVFKIK